MIRLEDLEIEGFGVFRDRQVVSLGAQGRVLVLGDNRDTDAASSNGAGKTTVLRALGWCLYGKTLSGLPARAHIHVGARAARVRVVFSDGLGGRFRVTRRATRRGGSLLLERIDVSPVADVSQSDKRATQAALEALLGLDWGGWRCTVLFGQGDRGRFASPELTDAARKDVLARVLDLGRYEAARERARARRGGCDERLAALEAEAAELRAALAGARGRASRAEGVLEGLGAPDALAREATALEVRASAAAARAAALREEAAALEVAAHAASAARAAAAALREITTQREASAIHQLAAAELTLSAAVTDGPCPTCGAARAHDPPAEAAARCERDRASEMLAAARSTRRDADAALSRAGASLATARAGAEGAAAGADRALLEAREARAGAARQRASLTRLNLRRVEAAAAIEAALAEAAEAQAALDALAVTRASVDTERRIADWWVRVGFGPKGAPAFAIEQALPVLNAHTNRHLVALTDGDLQVEWRPTAEAADGSQREHLTPGLTIEGVVGATPSGGQQKKIELACEVALAEMTRDGGHASLSRASGVDAMFLDEVLDGLDEEGQARVCDWLETLGVASLFVISHDAGIAERFDRALTVIKQGSASTILAS